MRGEKGRERGGGVPIDREMPSHSACDQDAPHCPLLFSLALITALPTSTPFLCFPLASSSSFKLFPYLSSRQRSLPSIRDDIQLLEHLFALGRRGEGKRVGGTVSGWEESKREARGG